MHYLPSSRRPHRPPLNTIDPSASPPRAGLVLGLLLLGLVAAPAARAGLSVSFTKTFSPSTIGPGSTTTLIFTLTNPDPMYPLDDLAFTDTLPAGVTIAFPARARTFCAGTLSAPAGGTTITFSGGRLGTSSSCTVRVNVTSATVGTHMNVSGTLTSNAGSHGTAAADLTVDATRPGFFKSFSPDPIPRGGLSTLTFVIDNSVNPGAETFLGFSDSLPAGVVVAPAPKVTLTGCGPVVVPSSVTATPGANSVSFNAFGTVLSPAVAAGATCTISVNVTATANGTFDNVSSDLELSGDDTSGFATDRLSVPLEFLNKVFTDNPVPPGGTVTLEFTVLNPDRVNAATDVTFSDDLESVISGLAPSGPLPADPCGAGSSLSFAAGTLTLSGGSLAPAGSCTFNVTLLVPAGASSGAFGNTTTAVTATIDGMGVTGNTASDVLLVSTAPVLTKTFTDDPVGAGGTVTLEFTIVNTSSTSSATDIAFTDDLNTAIIGLGANSLVSGMTDDPVLDVCGSGSKLTVFNPPDIMIGMITIVTPPDPTILEFTGGSLDPAGMPDDFCTFSVTLDVPAGVTEGAYTNTTSPITATVDGGTETGNPASGDLIVVGAPILTKEFTDDPVSPGGTVTVEFTLNHRPEAGADAVGIAFTDDLTALAPAVPGLVATSVASNDCPGATVDVVTDPTLIDVSGGTLMPGESCTIAVTLSVPAGATPGLKANTTSDVTATVGGVAVIGNPGEDTLRIAGLILIKEFIDDPAIPGGTVTLRFTLDNTTGAADATAISFIDDFDASLPGLTPTGLPLMDVCGMGSEVDEFDPPGPAPPDPQTIELTGGSVPAGTSCFFDVTLDVPATIPNPSPPPSGPIPSDGVYGNTTGPLTATIGGTPGFVLDPAFDELVVDSELLALTKSFIDDPTVPGGTVTLEITIENLDATRAASASAVSDDLGAALAGLTIASALPDDCGGTLAGVGTDMLTYSGGSLAAGAICTIRLLLDLPPGPLPGNTFSNTTSTATGTIAGLPVFGAAASDDLNVFTLTLSKTFSGVGSPGGTLDLEFTLTNLDSTAGAVNLSFSDSLPAGLTAVAPLPTTPCGAGSTISGTSFLTFSGGSLDPSGTCSFTVTLLVPTGATPGSFPNVTSDLLSAGLPVGGPGTDNLIVTPITSFTGPTATGAGDATVTISGGGPFCGFTQVAWIALEGDPGSPPAGTSPVGVVFPFGLLDFVISNCVPGSTVDFTLTFPTAPPADTDYWKYGPTPGNPTPAWYVLPATLALEVITFSITDGGLGDDDLTADGTIAEPGGPGFLVPPPGGQGIPTLGPGLLAVLAVLLALTGVAHLRRRSGG